MWKYLERLNVGQLHRPRRQSRERLSKSTYYRSVSQGGSWLSGLLKWNNLAGGVLGLIWTAACVFCSVNLLSKRLSLFFTGTISVIYLIFLVTYKAIRLGFHLDFHWFHSSNQFFVPGKGIFFCFSSNLATSWETHFEGISMVLYSFPFLHDSVTLFNWKEPSIKPQAQRCVVEALKVSES